MNEICGKFSIILEKAEKEGLVQIIGLMEKPNSLVDAKSPILSTGSEKENKSPFPSTNKAKKDDKSSVNDENSPRSPPLREITIGGKKGNNSSSSSAPSPSMNSVVSDLKSTESVSGGRTPAGNKKEEEKPITKVEPLDDEDIVFLVDRFEISGFIHYGNFMEFFNDLYLRWNKYSKKYHYVSDEMVGISPFRLSSEWKQLKQSSILRQSYEQSVEKSEASISRNKDKLVRASKEGLPPKGFTAPKKVPSQSTLSSEPSKKEEKPKVVEEEEKSNAVEEEKEKKEKEVEKDQKKTDVSVAAPPSGLSKLFGCFGGSKAKPLNEPTDFADDKTTSDSPDKPGNKGSKGGDKDSDEADEKKGKRLALDTDALADGKHDDDSISLKRDESFDTPKNIKRKPVPKFDRYDNNKNTSGLPDRDGLGRDDEHERERRKVVISNEKQQQPQQQAAAGGKGGRFRRRADRNFDQEKPELDDDEDSNDMEINTRAVKK
jgi:hypothetical protein